MNALAPLLAAVLIAGLFLGGTGLGAAALRLMGRLVGGTWSETPTLAAVARLATLGFVFAFAARALLGLGLPAEGYLAQGWLTLRLVFACAVWIGVAWLGAGRPSAAVSAMALVAFGVSLPLMGFDLIDSLEPGWVSSAEAYALCVRMLGAALAAVLLLAPPEGRDRRDLQGLLVATLLATLYLNLMSYLVPWYGDLPDKTAWIRMRADPLWPALITAALGLGAVLPLPLLALKQRLGETAARTAAGLALLGFGLQTVWLIAPPYGLASVVVAGLLAVGGGAGLAMLVVSLRRRAHA